eukprot:c28174_g1_i1.p1 GENE.c28174_g1_i1~~c28174_g1_i1.p1  ORF type:complete len:131 (-),score=12.34 c28174_g1_i1:2-394(-)
METGEATKLSTNCRTKDSDTCSRQITSTSSTYRIETSRNVRWRSRVSRCDGTSGRTIHWRVCVILVDDFSIVFPVTNKSDTLSELQKVISQDFNPVNAYIVTLHSDNGGEYQGKDYFKIISYTRRYSKYS